MHKTMMSALLAALCILGLSGCGDDTNENHHETGARTVSEAARRLCQDYLTTCGTDDSEWSEENCAQINENALAGVSQDCALATLNYTYCVFDNLTSEFCEYYWEERELTAAEAEKAAEACVTSLMEQAESCR